MAELTPVCGAVLSGVAVVLWWSWDRRGAGQGQGGKGSYLSQLPEVTGQPHEFAPRARGPRGRPGRLACLWLQFVLNIRNVCLFLLLLIWQ